MNVLTFTMALAMGFTGSLHCAGMCGPIVWVMPFQHYNGLKKAAALGLYHTGRISVYALLAIVLHSFSAFFTPAIQQYISMLLGGTLLIIGALSFIPNYQVNMKLPWTEYIKIQLSKFMGKPGLFAITMAGILNGLLPCGLVYMALSVSLSMPDVLRAASIMYVFGAGTLPMLISITLLKTRLSFLRRYQLRRLVPVVVFLFGCLFMLRGMNMGIPYLSPKITVEAHAIKACCCHK